MHLGIDLGWLILCLFLTHFPSRDLAGTKMFALFTNLNRFNVHVFKPFKVCKLCIFFENKGMQILINKTSIQISDYQNGKSSLLLICKH